MRTGRILSGRILKAKAVRDQGATILSLLGLITVWQMAAMAVNDTLILPSFLQVSAALLSSWQMILIEIFPPA